MATELPPGAQVAVPMLEGAASLLNLVAAVPGVGPVAAVVLGSLSGLATLVSRLVQQGVHPADAIAVWSSAVPDVQAANARIDALVRSRSEAP